jgi:hypothetical protein
VVVAIAPALALLQPHVLFDRRHVAGPIAIADYDVAADGRTFVMVKNEAESTRLNLGLGWTEELKRVASAR